VPLAVVTSREVWGRRLRTAGVLLVPEESRAPSLLQRAWALAQISRV
jgi:membrane glycosyltransferase